MSDTEQVAMLTDGVNKGAWRRWRRAHPEIVPDLSAAKLCGANLRAADLHRANLKGADLTGADLTAADFFEADLSDANFTNAHFGAAIFVGANLSRAGFYTANLSWADFRGADFSEASMAFCNLGGNDLSETRGLDTVRHTAPSEIGIDTIYRSKGRIPLAFLRGAGVPEHFIEYIPSLVAPGAIQFYSCFISYSAKDQEFADRLYLDLQNKGVRCWFAPHDIQG